jgi:putative ABC transport system substrate-binding protein
MQFDQLKRRDFMSMLGSVAAWPLAARAQQAKVPVIGFMGIDNPDERSSAFRQGLKEAGFVEGQNVAVEYRWAQGRSERLLLADEVIE